MGNGDHIRELSIDIETYSSVDLSRSGVYRYAEAPDFRVLLFGYSVDGGPVSVVDLACGESIPPEILSALTDDRVIKWAFNAAFERVCLSRFLGVSLSPSSWRCSMVWCAYLGLPMSLAGAGGALNLEQQKMTEGKKLIRLFCMPELSQGDGSPVKISLSFPSLISRFPEKWSLFKEYNRRDVETEEAIRQRLRKYPVPEMVWKEYALDQAINDRGIRVDMGLVESALALDEQARGELTEELRELTALANPNSVVQIRQWLADHGTEARDLSKKQVKELLLTADPAVRPVLLLRQQLAKSSVKKYQAMADTVCADGRIRGMFQFYGAWRSGRWAGRGVQLQNLPQTHLPDLDEARKLALGGDMASLKLLYDSVPDVLSELIRTAFVPEKGKKFIVADFSAIEARVIAWLAGETWRSDVFAAGGDIYCASASRMFGVPVEKHGINGHLRQKGKVSELALGYGGGVGALKAMGALEMGVPEEELQGLVTAWRSASPNIVRLWWDIDRSVKAAISTPGTVLGLPFFSHRDGSPVNISRRSGMLFIRLPSGRSLTYASPTISTNRFGGMSVTYLGTGPSKKWERIESYGPKFVENIVQGIARDLLAAAMVRLEEAGYRIVAHVHDEVVVEAGLDDSVDDVCRIMGECPRWAEGLLLRADGYECAYYRKD